ncbi:MAG: antibiotic biosynthesis monooxygenase, partial [Saprospiraceae bacterium]|nr:antibiotic biosynthesis monooxygenase [Saprospiraceae bacterium]
MSAGITRIVMMTFKSNEVETFINIFKESQALIQAFPGCNKVQLHKNIDDPCIMYTVSLWDNDECLQN